MGDGGRCAMNSLMQVKNASASVKGTYFYDALGRRMVEVQPSTNLVQRLYYSLDWQVVEEQRADTSMGAARARSQYVWGLSFVDDLVLRGDDGDGNSATGSLGVSGSGLERRVYAQQDANHNVTSLGMHNGT